jgi:predicted P-loop ATPase
MKTLTPSINEKHLQEWLDSGVDEKIIDRNVRTLTDSYEVDKILNRNTKRTWKRTDELVPCWQVSGIDPLTEERSILGVQIKPDTAPINKNGKPQKYIGATGFGASPLFLDTGIEGYWKSIMDDISIPLFITEGAKKAGAGLSIGKATVSIPGVSTCRKNGRLHHLLIPFTGFGRLFYLCFDNDVLQKKPVQDALLAMGRELAAKGSKVMIVLLPPGDHKGMDDFIANNGENAFNELVFQALTIEEWKQQLELQWAQQEWELEDERKSKIARYFQIVKNGWGDGLRLNKLKTQIELNGEPLDLNHIRQRIAMEFDTDVPIGDAQAIVEMISGESAYNPVVDYLDTLQLSHPNIDTSILDDLATRYFGTTDPLHNTYLKKCLIASVARARHSGCKHDTATILVGNQGAFKSTFWKVLYSEDWFTDELGDANEKDELMKLHRFWCLEWSEFESVYRRKDVSSLKKFMSSTTDAFRTPYSRTVREYPRASVLVGTTNEREILADPTGSRRFWVIPVIADYIPVDRLVTERDKIWAAADALYRSGHHWWLTHDEQKAQSEANQEFEVKDPWLDKVKTYIEDREYVTISPLLEYLGVEIARQDIAAARRLGAVLRRLKWDVGTQRINGHPVKVWRSQVEKNKNVGLLEVTNGSSRITQTDELLLDPISFDIPEIVPENLSVTELCTLTKTDHHLAHAQQGIPATKNEGDPLVTSGEPTFLKNTELCAQGSDPSHVHENHESCEHLKSICIKFVSPIGEVKGKSIAIDPQNWQLTLSFPDETTQTTTKQIADGEQEKELRSHFTKWLKSLRFTLKIRTGFEEWKDIPGCKCIKIHPHFKPQNTRLEFKTPDGSKITKWGFDEFELEV